MRLGPDEADGNSAQSGSQERTPGIFVLGLKHEIHQERRFLRVAVVVGAATANLKSGFFVERDRGGIGFANFQKDCPYGRVRKVIKKILQKERRKTATTMILPDCEIEDFGFLAKMTPLQQADQVVILFADEGTDLADTGLLGSPEIAQRGRGKIGLGEDRANGSGILGAAGTEEPRWLSGGGHAFTAEA
jgi:hypothetical protein